MNSLSRLLTIARVARRYRLDTLLDHQRLPPAARLMLLPLRGGDASAARGERLRLALEALGPVFVKFGQLLSTRRDLLDGDIADELAKLQDQVPPFASDAAIAIVERELGAPVATLFAEFEPAPLASASVAQVHKATLHDGRRVVVKVVRPDIETTIRQDIALMFTLARLIERYLPDGRRLRPLAVVEDYQHTLLDELDMQREGANTAQLRRNFAGSPLLYVPEVHWDYTRRNVLVLERIHGIPVTDVAALNAQHTDMKLLAERGVEIFFTQVFVHNFFHADMHPGNIFVSCVNPASPQYIGIDCAIIGTLSEADQYYLARNLLAIFQRDYRLVAELHIECGWVGAGTRVDQFEAAIRSVCEPVFEKPLGEISFGQMVVYLFQTARRFDMAVQPSLVLLQKTLLHIEGLGRQLYPQLDLWQTAQPFLERWLRERYSPQNVARRLQRQLPGLLEALPLLPQKLLERIDGDSQQARQQQQIDQLREQLAAQQRWRWLLGAALIAVIAWQAGR